MGDEQIRYSLFCESSIKPDTEGAICARAYVSLDIAISFR